MNSLFIFLISFFAFFFFISTQSKTQDVFSSIEKKFDRYKSSAPKERVLIITDRDVYAPGDLIWFDATIYDIFTPTISGLSKEMKIYLINEEGMVVYSKRASLINGSAQGFIQIREMFTEGAYIIQGTTKSAGELNYYQKKIIIKKNVIPRFLIRTTFPDKDYIPGDQFDITLEFQDISFEPLRNVEYQVDFYDGRKKISGAFGKIKKTGKATVRVKVPLSIKSGVFSYKVTAECKNIESTLIGKFPLLTDQLFIDFYPENGKIIDGISTKIRIHAYDISGIPLATEADLLEDGIPILTFTSEHDGLGSFMINPDIGKKYQVQMKRPLFLDKKYELPPIEAKGIALKVLSKDQEKASYSLVNGYQSVRSVYLVGISEGEIFWTSEHEIDIEQQVDIDISKASGYMAHIVAFNAAEQIEGEHLLSIPGKLPSSIELTTVESSTIIRGKNEYELGRKSGEEGKVIFTAVSSPWIIDELYNQNISSVALPADIYRQPVFHGKGFTVSGFNDEVMEKYVNYYVPFLFDIGNVVNKTGAFSHVNEHIMKKGALNLSKPFIDQYKELKTEGKVMHINMLADKYFATSNPNYVSGLYQNKNAQRKPFYKEMLENNIPVMDVLMSIKPYSLVGNGIVFMSSAISISSQGGSLIVIDGITSGTNASVIRNLNPLDVETLSASTKAVDIQRYSAFNTVGLVEITLKKGESNERELEEELDDDMVFMPPIYDRSNNNVGNDFRTTLWWECVILDAGQDSANFIFYNSTLFSNVKGKVIYIPRQGSPAIKFFDFTIE